MNLSTTSKTFTFNNVKQPRVILVLLALTFCTLLSAADVPYVNWENHPVHALDLSPDKTRLAVAHTADNRVQLFDVSQGYPVRLGHVKVGVDPVSVRFRDNNELWVVNHISDSVSVVDFNQRMVINTLQTEDEPFDVVFANSKAFVSCSQVNKVMVFNVSDLTSDPEIIELMAEEPRAMTVNSDGSQVYVASFESGNKTTILAGGIDESEDTLTFPFNPVNQVNSPYQGENPPPNDGNNFFPAINHENPIAPKVSLIVKQADDGRWLDDNNRDWTAFISGSQAESSGRIQGWELLDHDISVIDTTSHEISYVTGLMNIGMAIGFNQAKNKVTVVGTDATNEIRFEPVLNGKFLQVKMGSVSVSNLNNPDVVDLNPHLDYANESESQSIRDQSIGDPRGVVWNLAGDKGYVAGMGSNNVIIINELGERLGRIEVGEGATGLALDDDKQRLYVWNHFVASISVIDLSNNTEIAQMAVFNPLPEAIKQGRQFLYDTHQTSGLGQIACASCHVDGRMDRLAWDLGDPAGEMKIFNQNCQTTSALIDATGCSDFHPMKGPMVTQTFQDIIGNEPFHWRGDRDGIEEFNGAFRSLNGDDERLRPTQMQQFKAMLDTITFPPNPFRNIDNSLPSSIDLSNHYTSGRFQAAGLPLGSGNPINGLSLYNNRVLDSVFQCASCHTLPTGMAVNGPLKPALINLEVGGQIMPSGPMGENHLGVVSVDGSTQKAIKTPQLRNMYEKVGFETSRSQSLAGFGFLHDGAIDSVSRFLSTGAFSVNSDQEVADLVALMMAFSGSELDPGFVPLGNTPPESQDTHAGVGKQYTLLQASQVDAQVAELLAVADSGKVDMVARMGSVGSYLYDVANGQFVSSSRENITTLGLMSMASPEAPITFSLVPDGLGERLAFDRDGDGIYDEQEIINGSDLTDENSTAVKPLAGLWYNPSRSGHGLDLQHAGENMFVIWYTYNDDGTPTWYIASGAYSTNWQANLIRVTWDSISRTAVSETVGFAQLDFTDGKHATFSWEVDGRPSSEPFQYYDFAGGDTINQQTGSYYDANDSGWGVSVITQGSVAVSIIFYYDENGEPIWALGVGNNQTTTNIDMYANTGFCPDCDFGPTNDQVFVGTMNLIYSAERNIDFDVNLSLPINSINWNLNDVNLSPLSSEIFDPRLQ